jgi:hypothetical protein
MCKIVIGSVNCRGLSSDSVKRREIYSVDIEINMTLLFWWIHTVQKSPRIFGEMNGVIKLCLVHISVAAGE